MNKSILKCGSALAALLIVTSCSSSGDGGSGGGTGTAAVNPVTEVSSSNGILSGGGTAQYDADTKTITLDGTAYTFTDDPATSGTHTSTDGKLVTIAAPAGLQYTFVPAYLVGTDLGTSSAKVTDSGAALFGDLTPVDNLPTSQANYEGNWHVLVTERDADGNVSDIDAGDGSSFSATADFGAAKSLTGTLKGADDVVVMSFKDTTISGNTFSGTLSPSDTDIPDVPTQGGFFGPNAEEIGGTGHGVQTDSTGASETASVGFYGIKQEVPDS